MNFKAIAVYLDDSDKMETELSWLYKTWKLYSLEDEYDLVVYHKPSAKHRIEKFPDIVSIEMSNIRMSNEYKFLNSHYFCLDEWSEPLKKYQFILKTDCDVFLTENLRTYTPSKFMVGQGGYYDQTDINKINYIKKISKDYNLGFNNMSNIGASFYGKTEQVLKVVTNQAILTEIILKNYSKTQEFKDVGFDEGISSMIAGEIFINHAFNNQHVNLYGLDSKCWESTKIGSDVLHIHAWHTDQKWSKHNFFKGLYNNWIVDDNEAFKNAANYCQWIATMSMDKLNDLKFKYRNNDLKIDYDLMIKKVDECVFKNDGNVVIKLPTHKYSGIFKTRDNHEVMFRRINAWLIDNQFIKNNIIDLGSWIGDNSIPWSKKIDGIVYAIDPSPSNGNFIRELIKLNEIINVKIIQKAISDKNKTISTRLEFGENLHHCSFGENEDGKTKLESYSLDYLYETGEINNIGFIHLDVEGMEFSVIKGCEQIIKECSPIITFEQHVNSDDYVGLSNFLLNLGYKVYMINESLPGCNRDCRNFLAFKNIETDIITDISKFIGQDDLFLNFEEYNLQTFI